MFKFFKKKYVAVDKVMNIISNEIQFYEILAREYTDLGDACTEPRHKNDHYRLANDNIQRHMALEEFQKKFETLCK